MGLEWMYWTKPTAIFFIAIFLMLSGVSTAVLLLVPATGDVRRGAPDGKVPRSRYGMILGYVAAVLLVGLMVAWGVQLPRLTRQPGQATTAVLGVRNVDWKHYGPGLELARNEGRPVLIDFYAERAKGGAAIVDQGEIEKWQHLDARPARQMTYRQPLAGLVERNDQQRQRQPAARQANLLDSPSPSTFSTQRAHSSGCSVSRPTSARWCQQRTHLPCSLACAASARPSSGHSLELRQPLARSTAPSGRLE